MVTDSVLSVIIFKWAMINDVSVRRVLQAPGWMTSALLACSLLLSPFSSYLLFSSLSLKQTHVLSLGRCGRYIMNCSSLSLCHPLRKGSRATSPQVRSIILTLQSIFIDFAITVAA